MLKAGIMYLLFQIVFEALQRLQWSGFKSWLQDNGHPTNYITLTNAVDDIRRDFSAGKFNRLLTMTDFINIFDLFKMYSEEDNGPL